MSKLDSVSMDDLAEILQKNVSKTGSVSIKDLAKILQKSHPDMSLEQLVRVVRLIFGEISDALICGDKIELRGYWSLNLKVRSPYARNPRTNKEISVPNNTALHFKPSRKLSVELNQKLSTSSS